jgi:hypothetical protein
LESPDHSEVIIRRTVPEDIDKIVSLQKESFPYLARTGNIWHPDELRSHLEVFSEGQCVADLNGHVIGSASSLVVQLQPEYVGHTWKEITGNGLLTAFMEPTYLHIQNTGMSTSERDCMILERNW